MAYLKALHCAQTIPSLSQLVELIVTVVPKMRDFLIILAMSSSGFALAFMLVFKTRSSESRFREYDPWNDELAYDGPSSTFCVLNADSACSTVLALPRPTVALAL